MTELQPYIELYDKLEREIKDLATVLEAKSRELLTLRQTTIPDLLEELGLKEVSFSDGRTLKVGEFFSVKMPEDKNPMFDWMAANGFGALVTCNVSALLDRSDDAEKRAKAMKVLQDAGFQFEEKQALHPARLKAWAQEQLKKGTVLPDDLFTIQKGSVATLK